MVNLKPVLFVIGLVLSKIALFMYIPTLTAFFTGTAGFLDFGLAVIITHLVAFACLTFGRTDDFRLNARDMFVITTFVWIIASAFAALPFVFINHISFTDAYFETMSGITTTGSTVLSGLQDMAPAILLWRSILQWLGGVGFIVMGVAILPFLNVGGMRLFQTESSDWSAKSSPRTKSVATSIMKVYLFLSALCYLGFWLTGMSPFDAVNHTMATLSTGGFSTRDTSLNDFSHGSQWVATIFMFAGGLPFLLLIQALRRKSPLMIFQDAQIRGFTYLVVITSLMVTAWLVITHQFGLADAFRLATFNIVSVVTTTGFALGDFTAWGPFASVIFAFMLIVGGCSGSTAGGAKIFRFQVALALLRKQIQQLVHPSGVFVQRYNGRPVNEDIVRSVVAFAITYIMTILVVAMVLAATGLDGITSLTGAMTAVANVGPGMGTIIGPTGNFASLPDTAKWALSIGMLMGRLEILTVLVLLFPVFWRD
ncbi:TrkH family potassium uptake protein [Enterovibrio paralichthyis]|uniref:TrkH family potassium uptake protein n=1 Tax=Enterovibrio paralichthyis TaxID=2853805 RepID=UPI001C458FB3|nr:TrkH family potassium uptake protein [Enterovibrio paralichthyis]MBV7300841.1 TrkH family potassium uptake protein [Enterovibrio paralichthyis]